MARSRTEDFFAIQPPALPAPPTRSLPVQAIYSEASTSSVPAPLASSAKPSLEERLLQAVQDLASQSSMDQEDQWTDSSGADEEEAWTPADSPLATPTFLPKHHDYPGFHLKPALKRESTGMQRTPSNVSFEEEATFWETYDKLSYPRRGSSPIAKLTMVDLLELQSLDCLPWQTVFRLREPDGLTSSFDSSSEEGSQDDSDAA